MPINESHPVLVVPSTDVSLWRYMDLAAFLSLLIESSLCFVRADLMEDRFEGTFPKLNAQSINEYAENMIQQGKLHSGYRNLSEILTQGKRHTYMNCWCKENTEMVHMWKIYSKQNGIAIETSYERLKTSIVDEESVYPTEIRYMNFDNEIMNYNSNGLSVFTVKRIEYKSESELRLLLAYPRHIENQLSSYKTHEEIEKPRENLYKKTKTIKIKINLEELIKAVHVSPFAPEWYFDLVKKTLSKFELENIPVKISTL